MLEQTAEAVKCECFIKEKEMFKSNVILMTEGCVESQTVVLDESGMFLCPLLLEVKQIAVRVQIASLVFPACTCFSVTKLRLTP